MSRWTCPRCDREFGRAHQAHTCVPGGTVDETFAGRAAWQREAYDRIEEHITSLGPVHVDAVGVGVFLKSDRKLAEIRPMARSLTLYLMLPYGLDHARVTRTLRLTEGRIMNVVRLTQLADVDDTLRAWLTVAYDAATA